MHYFFLERRKERDAEKKEKEKSKKVFEKKMESRTRGNRRKPPNCTDYHSAKESFRWEVPSHFNFARDVVDRRAREQPNKVALLSINDEGTEALHLTFSELSERSTRYNGSSNKLIVINIDNVARQHMFLCSLANNTVVNVCVS